MLSVRNVGGSALFLFGTTFLWLTPSFAAPGIDTGGGWWSITAVLSLIAAAGFTVATWGLFTRTTWWERVAVASAVVGLLVLVPYWLAASGSGVTTPGFDIAIHAAGAIGVLVLLRTPPLERWVRGHVATGH